MSLAPTDLARIKNSNVQDHHLASAATDSDYKIETNVRNSRVYYNTNFSKSTQGNFFANYNRSFGAHQISAMVGAEASSSEWRSTRLAYVNTPKDYLGDWNTAGDVDTGNSTSLRGEGGTLSYFGTLNYSYQSKYLLQFLFRSDASTKFAPEHYWGYFPSLQTGWIVSKEDWFQNNVSWVDFFKVRYSIGKTGKDNLQAWKWVQLYDLYPNKGGQFGDDGGQLGPGLSPKVNPNRDAVWDTTLKQNIGLDFNVLDNRLQVNADFYYDRTTGMFTDMASAVGVPISLGGGFAEQNYGAVDAWGSEFGVTWSDKIKSDFSYNVGVNFGFQNNKVVKYPEQGVQLPSDNSRKVGQSGYNAVWGFETWKGTSTGDGILRTDEDIANYWNYLSENATAVGGSPKYIDITDPTKIRKGSLAYRDVAGNLNADGTLAVADGQIMTGNDYVKLANSDRTYGFTSNLGMKYKGISFRTQISTSWGGANFYDLVNQGTSSAHNMWSHETFWNDMYGEDNLNGKYPNMAQWSYMSNPSDFWQLDTFRCYVKNLTVAYEIPKQALVSTKLQNVSVGITGNNLWDLYNPYPDHYRNMYDNSSSAYPTLRTWTVNLNISF